MKKVSTSYGLMLVVVVVATIFWIRQGDLVISAFYSFFTGLLVMGLLQDSFEA